MHHTDVVQDQVQAERATSDGELWVGAGELFFSKVLLRHDVGVPSDVVALLDDGACIADESRYRDEGEIYGARAREKRRISFFAPPLLGLPRVPNLHDQPSSCDQASHSSKLLPTQLQVTHTKEMAAANSEPAGSWLMPGISKTQWPGLSFC